MLIRSKDAFINAQIEKAKALAYAQLAADKYKEYLEKVAERDQESSSGVVKLRIRGGVPKFVNLWREKDNEAKALLAEFEDYAKQANATTTKAYQTMTDAEIIAADNYEAGTVAALEHLIAVKRNLLQKATSKEEYDAGMKEIEEIEKKRDAITGGNKKTGKGGKGGRGGSGSRSDDKDPFAEMLKIRKELYAEYLKWVTSEDETVRKLAETEFAGLLKEGTSYLDFLNKQRDLIDGKAKKTAADIKNLHTINNEIANATKQTAISDFDAQLTKELEQCKTIGEMLKVIEQKRSELKGDNSDVDNAQKGILDAAETDVKKQAKDETDALLKEYASYLQEKIAFDESYARKRELLTKKAATATSEDERKIAEAALAALEKKRAEYQSRSGSEKYDELLTQYKTYQQQQNDILQKYAEQRAEAEKQNNFAMLAQIDAAQQQELSKLAAQRLMSSESWNQLFGDLTQLSQKTIKKLMDDINAQRLTLSAQMNPADLKAIQDQLDKAKEEIHKRNPFAALKDGLAEVRAALQSQKLLDETAYGKELADMKAQYEQYAKAVESNDATLAASAQTIYADLLKNGSTYLDALRRKLEQLNGKKITVGLTVEETEQLNVLDAAIKKEEGTAKSLSQGIKDTFSSAASSIDFLKGTFDSVVNGMKKMGVQMDEETETILNDIGGMMEGASQLATGIASGNPLSIIQGSIGLLSSVYDIFNSRDRKAERSIKKHENAIKKLGYAYNELEQAVKNALGEEVYKNQSAQIDNLRRQQIELQGMISDEKGKKHTDWDRVADFEENYKEIGRQIEDIMNDITASVTQTTFKDLSSQLADALVEAFGEGKDAAEEFGKVADDVIKNAVKNALRLQYLETPLQNAIKQLQHDMGFDDYGNGEFNGLSDAEQKRFKQAVEQAGANFKQAMEVYKDLFAGLDENDPSTLSGAIKGASQESIDLLAGQTNAVRQNQVASIAIIRQQLMHLANIDSGVANTNAQLQRIYDAIKTPVNDGLRSQGIIK